MTKTRARIVGTLSVLMLTGSLFGAGSAAAADGAEANGAADCGANEICFWADNDMPGAPTWRWSPGSGTLNLPPELHDNVGSFQANAAGCFIDTDPSEKRGVIVGDYSNAYKDDGKFGSRIDQVAPGC
ncbi:hypothetical protein FCH28_07580 [Streptomyces piniterrae]|uniref:Peptidase inhibitor family I36 protein n=1 Tax=Streptomyces piniterrae TaxID=2571125 RepID=A0A4U0NRZ7_9ACTN|nr:hypothetical protein [Streptomyces piniterrae]TJZ57283.1 hypothetical protein FCH28_07580 [Streptomyces piniterrae]